MAKEKDPLQIAKEDVLRFLREINGAVSRDSLYKEIGEKDLVEKAINELLREGLLNVKDDKVTLSEEGRKDAEKLYRTHSSLEEVLKEFIDDPHKAAHSIEHIVMDVEGLRMLRGKALLLGKLKRNEEAIILTVLEERPTLLSRLYGVGIIPGRKIRVIMSTRDFNLILIGPGNRVISIDREIAKKIVVIKEES